MYFECRPDKNVKVRVTFTQKNWCIQSKLSQVALLVSLIALLFSEIYIERTRVSDLRKETFNLILDVNISHWYCNVGKGKHGNLLEQGQYHNKVDVSFLRLTSRGIKAFLSNIHNKMAHTTEVCLLKSNRAVTVIGQFWKRKVSTIVNYSKRYTTCISSEVMNHSCVNVVSWLHTNMLHYTYTHIYIKLKEKYTGNKHNKTVFWYSSTNTLPNFGIIRGKKNHDHPWKTSVIWTVNSIPSACELL